MSIGTKIDSLLTVVIDDVVNVVESRYEEFEKIVNQFDTFKNIRAIMRECKESPERTIGAAAVSEVVSTLCSSMFSDGNMSLDEVEVAREVISKCLRRYSWIEGYKKFDLLVDGKAAKQFFYTWTDDTRPLGGEYTNGSIMRPFRSLVLAASFVTRNAEFFDRYSQVILLIAKLIVAEGGISKSEQEWLDLIKDANQTGQKLLLSVLREPSREPNESTSSEVELATQEQLGEDKLTPAQALKDALSELHSLVGVSEVKTEISRLANFLRVRKQRMEAGLPIPTQSLHFVFTGNPGTGKTTVARILSRLLYGFEILKTHNLVETDRASLVGGYVGQTAIKTSEAVEKARNGVLFIDEAYTLSKKEGGSDYGQEAIDTILKKMEDCRDSLVVIAAGYPEQMKQFLATNPGLESRFTRFIHFDDYHVADLWQIFERMCKANTYSLTQEARANLAILCNRAYSTREKNFGNARFVRNAYEKTLGNHADRLAAFEGQFSKELLVTIEASDLPYDMVSGMRGPVDVTNSRWRGQCPGCEKVCEAGISALNQQVRCKCGKRFIFPAWNLNPKSIALSDSFTVLNRSQDLIGIEATKTV